MNSDLKISLAAGLIIFVLFLFLGSCSVADYPPIVDVEDTREVATDIPTSAPSATFADTPTIAPSETAVCPPRYLEGLTVGYIPALDLGGKQSTITVDIRCGLLTIYGYHWFIDGVLADDGLSLASCTLYADRQYPCDVYFRNSDNLNVAASYTNKAGKDFTICVAADYQNYGEGCE